jgi:23S rRNA pseudouridine1911/1915/1917 synthase
MTTPYSMLDEVRYHGGQHANAVHRIDKETSGLLLASRHKEAERFLKGAFERKAIQKSYRAWARGRIEKPFSVDAPILLNDDYGPTKHKVFIHPDGKRAYTTFLPLEYDEGLDATLLECIPHTGRTHQIRIHLFHVKHPILGDPIYGPDYEAAEAYLEERLGPKERLRETGASRLMLHAYSVRFDYGRPWYLVSRNDFSEEREAIAAPETRKEVNDGWK